MAKNTNVISHLNSSEHVIDSYHFKVMSEFSTEEKKPAQSLNSTPKQAPITENVNTKQITEDNAQTEEEKTEQNEELVSQEKNIFQSDFVEDLLKKTDEMSGNIIKLQMQMESKEKEFDTRLNTELENAKEKFTQEGYNQAKNEFDKEMAELKDKYLKSIAKLDEACVNLDVFISKNEQELANTAVEIAREVISKELENHSKEIALNLSKELMAELKDASNIEIRVSPVDYDFIKSHLQDSHLKISLDDAISKGSVIVLSDTGNIEANLNSRLAKIQKMIIK
ncbi:flagellar assembly protein FliH [Campylobacter sp. MIT 99-7217]|uniref:flagellar assembly protein FliH n=1 Tax=Campylobacter sp. MIT 99-7217 TaxID=535091 RepID=UPI001157D3EA|nr:flagellar assembly protein FliH [Campylobacter sp. MIT 99-7217]TQR30628.1 flagellar assembly protein FliH [Campylobacter sp. MIT 99-7217]